MKLREKLFQNLKLRHKIIQIIRNEGGMLENLEIRDKIIQIIRRKREEGLDWNVRNDG